MKRGKAKEGSPLRVHGSGGKRGRKKKKGGKGEKKQLYSPAEAWKIQNFWGEKKTDANFRPVRGKGKKKGLAFVFWQKARRNKKKEGCLAFP